MRRVEVRNYGGPDVHQVFNVEDPLPGPGEVLIDVSYAGVNFRDTLERRGLLPFVQAPFAAGVEGSGVVAAVGPEVSWATPGLRVAWFDGRGTYAERTLVREDALVPVPDGVPDDTAAALLLQGYTAHQLATLRDLTGKTALVHSAGGGVGGLLTQIIRISGGRIIATVSSAAKAQAAKDAGADTVVVTSENDFAKVALDCTDGLGVDAVFDGIGASTFEGNLRATASSGLIAVYGIASGPVPPIDLLELPRSIFIGRPSLRDHVLTPRRLHENANVLFDWVLEGRLNVPVSKRYPLEASGQAHTDLESRRTIGKLLISPQASDSSLEPENGVRPS